jgi:GxxExxY protein
VSLEHEELTGRIIGAAIDVHTELGPGFLESIYEMALAIALKDREIPFARQVSVPVLFQGVEVGVHRLDFLVAEEIVVELKALKSLEDIHFAVVKSYLRAVRRKHGLLLNFARPRLEIKRVSGSSMRPPGRVGSRAPGAPTGGRGCR